MFKPTLNIDVMKFLQNKDKVTKMLQFFKEHPRVWNRNHPHYRNLIGQREIYESLVLKIGLEQSNFSIQLVFKAWEEMLASYKHEKKKKHQMGSSGREYRPSIWYYDLMSFVDSSEEEPVASTSASGQCGNLEDSLYTQLQSETEKQSSSSISSKKNKGNQRKKFKNDDQEFQIASTMEAANSLLRSTENDEQKMLALKLILLVAFGALHNKLTENSKIM